MAYYTDLLNKLGFKATLKVIADSTYFQTIGNQSLNARIPVLLPDEGAVHARTEEQAVREMM